MLLLSYKDQGMGNSRQHTQGQHIHLQKTQGINVVFVPLNDTALGHACVFRGNKIVQAVACNDKATDMLRQVTRKAHELAT